MKTTTYKIRSVGGAAVVTIPQHLLRFLSWHVGYELEIDAARTGHGMALILKLAKTQRKSENKRK
jgi:antitoxin component of MazEF toxin-antitoxin module